MPLVIEHQDGRHLCALVAQVDGRFRLERRDFYEAAPAILFLNADSAYRTLRQWRIAEGRILSMPGLEQFAAIADE